MDLRAGAGRFSAFSAFTGIEDSSNGAEAPTSALLGRMTLDSVHRCVAPTVAVVSCSSYHTTLLSMHIIKMFK